MNAKNFGKMWGEAKNRQRRPEEAKKTQIRSIFFSSKRHKIKKKDRNKKHARHQSLNLNKTHSVTGS